MKKKLLLITVLLTTFFSFCQVPTSERDALIALYNSTDGVNWTNNTNWNSSEAVSSWYGVAVTDEHITSIVLSYNNLYGIIPSEIGALPELLTLNLYGNNLSGTIPTTIVNLSNLQEINLYSNQFSGSIPNLTALPLQTLRINYNNFQFGDFENEFLNYININNFQYSSMNKLAAEDSYDIIVGETYTFTMPSISGTGVSYQWYKNDEPISGETGLTLIITNAQLSDAADYTCKASSTVITGLTLIRNTIHLYGEIYATDKAALIALYNATNGNNWTNNTNWNTTDPVHTWYGVTVVGTRVTEISFYNNNLNGTLPIEIGNFSNLEFLSFWNNELTGNIPVELGNCTNIKVLSFEENHLTGNIPTTLNNLTAMTSFWLNGNQLSGDIPDIFSGWTNLKYFSIGNRYSSTNNNFTGDIDLSDNLGLTFCSIDNNNITSLNIKNGNNINMTNNSFGAENNANLTCVFVDDAAYSITNWMHIDSTATFLETQVECDALGVPYEDLKQDIEIFPNPTSSVLYIRTNRNVIIKKITLLNTLGQIIKEGHIVNSLDISNLPNGVYYVNFESVENNRASYKIIKK